MSKDQNPTSDQFGIDHGLNEFQSGQDYVLTLQDKNILEDQGEVDYLENTELQADFNQKIRNLEKVQQRQLERKQNYFQQLEDDQELNPLRKYDDLAASMK